MDSNKTEVSAMQPLRAARVFPAAALAVTGLAAAGCAQANDRQEKPNVILIYIDDMGYSDISAFGGNYTPTPNIDRIGQEGIQFNQYYTACPISSPSRVGVTTGMYPTKWGITTFLNDRRANCSNKSNDYLRPEAPTLARSMKEAGYATGHFGKWHMGGGRDVKDMPQIPEYGFDEYSSTWESPDPDPLLTASNWIWSDQDSVKRWERTEYFVDKTLDFLKRHQTRSPNICMRDGDWKLLVNYDGTMTELYNLADDKYETTNVAEKYPEITGKMKKQAIEWYNDSFRKHAGELTGPRPKQKAE